MRGRKRRCSAFEAQLLEDILCMLNAEVDSQLSSLGKFGLVERDSKLCIACYNRNDVPMSFRDEHDFVARFGSIEHFSSWPALKRNPMFGCKTAEEAAIQLDMMLDRSEAGF